MENEKKEKILIIEDERSLVDLLVAKLSKEGYQVSFEYDGLAGYEKMKELKPDLILLDIVMPKLDGYGVLEKMKEEGISIPVIIISNSGQPVEIEKTKILGAVDHLIKTDFSPTDVLAKVQRYLNGGVTAVNEEMLKEILKPIEDVEAKKNNIKVLLVEDDPFLGDICSKKMAKEGYTVHRAIDGVQAIEGAKMIKPNIILLDIILPAVDGFQILSEIRSMKDEVGKTPIIMLSNLGQESDIEKARELGANDYLVKAHFTTEEIVKKVESVLSASDDAKK